MDTLSKVQPRDVGATVYQKVSWAKVQKLCFDLAGQLNASKFTGVYGVPRGGKAPALVLSHIMDLKWRDEVEPGTLVVDEIVDTGRTLRPYREAGHTAVSLFVREGSESIPALYGDVVKPGIWLIMPWEMGP